MANTWIFFYNKDIVANIPAESLVLGGGAPVYTREFKEPSYYQELKKFDMRNISFKPGETQGPVIVLIGRRDTGKSFLVRDLLYYHQD